MHTTLDTVIFGTGITVLTCALFVASFATACAVAIISYAAFRDIPIFFMRRLKTPLDVSVKRRDGVTMSYKYSLNLLTIGRFSIIAIDCGDYDEKREQKG